MKLKAWAATDVGLKRKSNQDAFAIREDLGLYVVADGMGGHLGGEVASDLAIRTFVEQIEAQWDSTEPAATILQRAYSQASRKVYTVGNVERPELKGMGTTMVALWWRGDFLFVANVGDSRAYLYAGGGLWRVTEDHSLVNEQLRAGLITEEQAPHFQGKNIITRSVGFEEDVKVDFFVRTPIIGDRFLMCSDGLTGMTSERNLLNVLTNLEGESSIMQCITLAKAGGGEDNITAMVVDVLE